MALASVAAVFAALAIASCGTGAAEEARDASTAAPAFPSGSDGGALPGDVLGPPIPKWRPVGFEIEPIPPESRRLSGPAGSLDDLLRTVEKALAERDTQRLFDLMIDEREYREIFYPALPAAHPPIDARFETLWVTHWPDARRGVKYALQRFGGRNVKILSVRFAAPNQDFVNFVLHQKSRVDLIVDGEMQADVALFGSVLVVDGRWKVLSFPDDAP